MSNEGMTNQQFNQVLKMIVQIIKDSENKEDAVKKIEELIKQLLYKNKNSQRVLVLPLSIHIIHYKKNEVKEEIMNLDERTTRVQFGKNGQGYVTNRITLPVPWVKELGITEEEREVKIILEDDKIIIEKA